MLSKEQLENIRSAFKGKRHTNARRMMYILDHIDALQAQLDKLQDDYTAQSLALKAAKAMQQAETERADANEKYAKRYFIVKKSQHWTICNPTAELYKLDEHVLLHKDEALANEQDAKRYRFLVSSFLCEDDFLSYAIENRAKVLLEKVMRGRGPDAYPTRDEFDFIVDEAMREIEQ